ncbi:MAG: HAD family phosphatase [Propionibacteriaceae bacterium]|nr:HAD family phosphatase [Propionibacteriaceae bacterium]
MHAEASTALVPGVDIPAALLWDFDGTLVDSEKSWHAAEARLMAEWGGGVMTPEQHHSLVGNSLRDSALAIMEWTGRTEEDPDHWAGVLNDYALADMVTVGVDYRPGARELLDAARAHGVRCALVSASWTSVLTHVVDTMPAGSFEIIIGGDAVTHGKPDPEPYLLATQRLGLAIRDCLALEDSLPGTTSAHRAGLATLAIPFEQEIGPAPRRRLVPTLDGLTIAEVGAHWRELRDA